VDTLRLLFETRDSGPSTFQVEGVDGWRFGSIPSLGLTWAEGHPAPGELAGPEAIVEAAVTVEAVLDARLGVVGDLGVARSDQTVTTRFARAQEARAFLAGMAAVEFPRLEVTRRGRPVRSISWTHARGRRILGRCYDKGAEQGLDPFQLVRLEDQRRYPSGGRPPVEVVADGGFLRGRFEARFEPVRKAVDGVKAATFPVIAQALADEVRYGYRDWREAERLAGSLVLLSGVGADAYPAGKRGGPGATYYRRRQELREAGYVVVDDLGEGVEVDLGEVVEEALAANGWHG
jgi:hypothetical protein